MWFDAASEVVYPFDFLVSLNGCVWCIASETFHLPLSYSLHEFTIITPLQHPSCRFDVPLSLLRPPFLFSFWLKWPSMNRTYTDLAIKEHLLHESLVGITTKHDRVAGLFSGLYNSHINWWWGPFLNTFLCIAIWLFAYFLCCYVIYIYIFLQISCSIGPRIHLCCLFCESFFVFHISCVKYYGVSNSNVE